MNIIHPSIAFSSLFPPVTNWSLVSQPPCRVVHLKLHIHTHTITASIIIIITLCTIDGASSDMYTLLIDPSQINRSDRYLSRCNQETTNNINIYIYSSLLVLREKMGIAVYIEDFGIYDQRDYIGCNRHIVCSRMYSGAHKK